MVVEVGVARVWSLVMVPLVPLVPLVGWLLFLLLLLLVGAGAWSAAVLPEFSEDWTENRRTERRSVLGALCGNRAVGNRILWLIVCVVAWRFGIRSFVVVRFVAQN
jgi:hypothetical protein